MSDVNNVLYTHFIKLAKQALLFIVPCSATDYNLFEEDFPVLQWTMTSLRRTSPFCNRQQTL